MNYHWVWLPVEHSGEVMDRRTSYLIILSIATLIYFVVVGYNSESCPKRTCFRFRLNKLTGALLLTAGFLSLSTSAVLIVSLWKKWSWTKPVGLLLIGIAAILAMIATFYDASKTAMWSPFFAAVATSFTFALTVMLLFDVILLHI